MSCSGIYDGWAVWVLLYRSHKVIIPFLLNISFPLSNNSVPLEYISFPLSNNSVPLKYIYRSHELIPSFSRIIYFVPTNSLFRSHEIYPFHVLTISFRWIYFSLIKYYENSYYMNSLFSLHMVLMRIVSIPLLDLSGETATLKDGLRNFKIKEIFQPTAK